MIKVRIEALFDITLDIKFADLERLKMNQGESQRRGASLQCVLREGEQTG
ncbi:hypothetical protein KSF_010520 [Reticulibacter mediterranei]|uniref:Uncharacterized protein n=1 Tax=Reticulibacter mediterranei TaxID=2778369 RepID=A0A8J3I8V5_9CHLR|nr:hypothetical protein KSF_010520 [Reticulibacter mediterranei]